MTISSTSSSTSASDDPAAVGGTASGTVSAPATGVPTGTPTGVRMSAWERLARDAPAWEPFDGPLLVVVPHPDDETLSAGALIARQARAGRDVTILAVTDGDAAYGDADAELAALRRREQDAAVEALGLSPRHVVRLGIPDGRVADHEERVSEGIRETVSEMASEMVSEMASEMVSEMVSTAIADLIRPDTVVVAPWIHDVHPDHEACGRAAVTGVERYRRDQPSGSTAEVVFGVFWACHHLDAASVLGGYEPVAIDVDADLAHRRAVALRCHQSQFEHDGDTPILDPLLVAPATWPRQLFLRPHDPSERSSCQAP